MELRCKKVKDIVLENSASASVFFKYGIDYCNGNMSLEDLSGENSANIDEVLHDLENISHQGTPFYLWPLDLLLDYIIKYHHRNTKEKGAYLLSMIENVKDNYGMEYPELNELFNQVKLSMHDLESHFQKEESVLFPYLYELFDASHNEEYIETMHCGTISNPIRVMTMEHENERMRYMHLRKITNGFRVPDENLCINYEQMMVELETFVEDLFEHIFIENNILFPQFEKLEREWVR